MIDNQLAGSRVLVTGGAGFIGSNLVREALRQDVREVVVMDDFSNGLIGNLDWSEPIEVVAGDIRDDRLVERACQNCDFVFHLAALGSVPRSLEKPSPSYDVNVVGTTNVLEGARIADVGRVIYASSSSVYGNTSDELKTEGREGEPISPYASSKAAAELVARTHAHCYGVEVIGLRFFNVFGPFQRPDSPYAAVVPLFTSALLRGEQPMVYGNGEQVRDFTYVGDVVQALLLAATYEGRPRGEAINVSAGVGRSVLSLLDGVKAATGVFDIEPIHVAERPGDIRVSRADIARAQVELGFEPAWSIDHGLKEYVSWYAEHHGDTIS